MAVVFEAKGTGIHLYYQTRYVIKNLEDWVEPQAFLNLAIAHYENKRIDSLPHYLEKAQRYYLDKSADTKYYYDLYHARKGDTLKALS